MRKLGLRPVKRLSRDNLAREWNETGREHFKACSDSLTAHYEDGRGFEWASDPRPVEMAKIVLDEVLKIHASGLSDQSRALFDPAHEPFIPLLETQAQSIACVTILGDKECLIRLGTDYQNGDAIHILGENLTQFHDLLAFASSRNRQFLLLVQSDGFHIRHALTGNDTALLPWPCGSTRLDSLQISDDGARITFAHDELGIWLADVKLGAWKRLHPTDEYIAELKEDLDDPDYEWSESMTHCALSPDGHFVAYGTQDYGHDIYRIDEFFDTHLWASVTPNIDYPHNACFSEDGKYLALNGCHFYNGSTIVVDMPQSKCLLKPDYDPHPSTPMIENMLRVYASTWIPPEVTGRDVGAFVLAGSGVMTAVTPKGDVLFSQYFGSSAASIDYCPKTRRLYVGSSSGILHVYDIDRQAEPEQAFGYKSRHELFRWSFWKDHPPFRW